VILSGGQIPDASLIHLARKRRQLARERGDEFIPVEGGSAARDKKSSRLIRYSLNLSFLSLFVGFFCLLYLHAYRK